MQTIFDTCTPRPELRHGALSEDMFAARLRDVIDDKDDEVYQNPDRSFANTYPTDGLRTLLSEVLGRITGQAPTSSPILRLETSFGGGKTHNLIALCHAATRPCAARRAAAFWPGFRFQGGWERYQRIKQVSDALVKDKKLRSPNVDFRLVVELDGDLALGDRQFGDMRDALTNMGVSMIEVMAVPVYGEAT